MKKIWLTSLDPSKENVQTLMVKMKTYGLEVDGHFWKDDLEKLAWTGVREDLLGPKTALWVIMGSDEQLLSPSNVYGLSLLGIALQSKKGSGFPIVLLQTEGDPISSDKLSTILKGADILSVSNPALAAKLVAKVHAPVKDMPLDYRINIHGNEQIGQWLEVGPESTSWKGAMLGVAGADIKFHAVGPKGELPKTATLNYPVQGMKVTLGETEYLAWAVQNELDADSSYFVKVEGFPASVIFSSYSADEEADVFAITLKSE